MKKSIRLLVGALMLPISALISTAIFSTAYAANSATALQQLDPSVVSITINENGESKMIGSGVIVDAEKRLVVTTSQVLPQSGQKLAVKTVIGAEIEAEAWAADADKGIVLLQLAETTEILVPAIGSEDFAVGDFIVAVGRNEQNVSSLKLGLITLPAIGEVQLKNTSSLINTDVAVPTSSRGGPLIDVNGTVIGINIDADPEQEFEAQGYAIPFAAVSSFVIASIEAAEKKQPGRIGAHIQHVTTNLADYYQAKANQGVIVSYVVPGGSAELFGLRSGDIVTNLAGHPVNNVSQFKTLISSQKAGDYFELNVVRHGEPRVITLKTAATPYEETFTVKDQPRLGEVTLTAVDSEHKLYGIYEGVVMGGVDASDAAYTAGLRDGDLLFRVNQIPVTGIQGLTDVLGAIEKSVILSVKRNQSVMLVVLP